MACLEDLDSPLNPFLPFQGEILGEFLGFDGIGLQGEDRRVFKPLGPDP